MRKIFFLMGLAVYSGCAPNYVHIYSKVDPYDHLIYLTVRYQGAGSNEIKMLLREKGWEILDIDRVKITGKGNFDEYSHIESSSGHAGGYSLSVIRRDNFLYGVFTGNISSVISLVDNKSGEKVFMIAGRGKGLVKEFETALASVSEEGGK